MDAVSWRRRSPPEPSKVRIQAEAEANRECFLAMRAIVACGLQPRRQATASKLTDASRPQPPEDHMFAHTAERRLLGFDMGDWALLLGGFAFVGVVTMLAA